LRQKSNCKQNHPKIRLHSAAAVNPESEQPQSLKLMLKLSSILTDTPSQLLLPLIDLYQWCRDQSGAIPQLVVVNSNGRRHGSGSGRVALVKCPRSRKFIHYSSHAISFFDSEYFN